MKIPRLVVFEGPDGVGKTTLIQALGRYYKKLNLNEKLIFEWFPGRDKGTLGDLVYKMHHKWKVEEEIDSTALQVMHIAAHIDSLKRKLLPWFKKGGYVILDRFWWSTYAYGRLTMSQKQAWKLVEVERQFWRLAPKPVFIYLNPPKSFKSDEIDEKKFNKLKKYYLEILAEQRKFNAEIHVINNAGSIEETLKAITSCITSS